MKIEMSIEKLENGFILEVNEKRYAILSERDLGRKLFLLLSERNEPKNGLEQYSKEHFKRMEEGKKKFTDATVGELQAKVLKLIAKKGSASINDIGRGLFPDTADWTWRQYITKTVRILATKRFIKKISSRKYALGDIKPKVVQYKDNPKKEEKKIVGEMEDGSVIVETENKEKVE